MVEDNSQRGYFSFTLKADRLRAFESVTILTYMFADSPMEYWCIMNSIPVEHLKLRDDGELVPHDRQYSGKQFAGLIEVLKPSCELGSQRNHLSSTNSKGLTRGSGKATEHIEGVQKDLARLFRNRRGTMVQPDDFMFTCLSECKDIWANRKRDLPKKFIGESTWVQFGEADSWLLN